MSNKVRNTNKIGRSKDSPLITIGVSSFNAFETLRRAIKSALDQDWPNKEILVVDDASTDGCQSLLQDMARHHPELRVIRHQTNKGYAGSLNTIIGASRGEFLAIFDDDDESRRDRLTKQWQRLIEYERLSRADLVLCYANRDVVRAGQKEADHVALAIGREPPEPHGPIVAKHLFGYLADAHHVWGMLGSCTLMARRRTFRAIGDFDPDFRRSAELDFAVRAALQKAHFISVNEPLITQYKTASADKAGTIPVEYALKLRRKHKNYLSRENVYWASIVMAYAWFHGNAGRAWRHRLLSTLAYGLLPPSILFAKLRSRFSC